MNHLIHHESFWPRGVFSDRELTKPVVSHDTLGWMFCGEDIERVFRPKRGMIWIPVKLADKVHFVMAQSAA
jgi:hypothetical protein